jgi:hypothetical protein
VEVGSFMFTCIWREKNARNFEDSGIVMLELKKMFQSLYTWIVALFRLPVYNFS